MDLITSRCSCYVKAVHNQTRSGQRARCAINLTPMSMHSSHLEGSSSECKAPWHAVSWISRDTAHLNSVKRLWLPDEMARARTSDARPSLLYGSCSAHADSKHKVSIREQRRELLAFHLPSNDPSANVAHGPSTHKAWLKRQLRPVSASIKKNLFLIHVRQRSV